MALITCKNLSFAYDGRVVVDNISFEVEPGDYLCVVGANGSGKSTLIKGLLGLLKPQSGSIQLGEGLQQNEIGYLPQQTTVQRDFPASVQEVVLSGGLNHGWTPFYTRHQKNMAAANMMCMGIYDFRHKSYRELSGGQQQRVLLARALTATRKLLLMDEPVTGLDPLATQDLYELVRHLNQDGVTIIMVTHDIENAVQEGKHILHLAGRELYYGPADEYLQTSAAQSLLGGAHHV